MSDVPAHFFLLTASEFAGKFSSVEPQVFRMDLRNLFDGVSGSGSHHRVVNQEPGKQRAEEPRINQHLSHDFVGQSNRPAINAFELAQDCRLGQGRDTPILRGKRLVRGRGTIGC